jgi:hypothetical protein
MAVDVADDVPVLVCVVNSHAPHRPGHSSVMFFIKVRNGITRPHIPIPKLLNMLMQSRWSRLPPQPWVVEVTVDV